MILTGKAKEDFNKWFRENKRYLRKSYLDDTCDNALIIEWLDSVGIFYTIIHTRLCGTFRYGLDYLSGIDWGYAEDRHEATTEAIKQANIIYNEN